MSITIDEQLYAVLKKTAGPRGMSRFIVCALKDKLRGSRKSLYREYLSAKEGKVRESVLRDWDTTEIEGWR